MHPHFADGAMVLQAGVGLTQMAAMPHRRRSAVAPSVAETMEAGFLPALDEDQANMLPQRSCALGPQVTNPGYPGLSQFIW